MATLLDVVQPQGGLNTHSAYSGKRYFMAHAENA